MRIADQGWRRPAFAHPVPAATLVETPPDGDGWVHEVKHDGYRTEFIVEGGRARAFTRRGFDWSDKYPRLVEAAAALPVTSEIIDGEVIVMNEVGLSDSVNCDLRSAGISTSMGWICASRR